MANKYSSALEKAQKLVEEQDQRMQMRNSPAFALTKSPYSSAFEKIGALPQTTVTGTSAGNSNFMTPDQAPVTDSLIPLPSSNPTLNSLIAGQRIEEARRQAEEEQARQEARRQAISQAMNTGFLSKVKGNQQNQQPVMPEIPAAPATSGVSDPLQKIIDLVSGNTANADTRNPALPEVTVNRGVAADDWSRGIRQYTDANGNIVRDANGNAYAVDKLRFDGNNYSTVNQTDNDPTKNSTLDKILDSLEYIRAKGANALEREYQKFRANDAGLSAAFSAMGDVFKANVGTTSGGLKTPNLNPFAYTSDKPVLQSSTNENGRIKNQDEFRETAAASNLMGKAREADTKALEEYAKVDTAGKQLQEIEKKYGAVASNPVTRGIADLGAAIDGQIPYVALNAIPGIGAVLSASTRGALSRADAYAEARREGATKTQARAYSGREAINQGAGDLLISGIAGRGAGALGKVIANNKVGRALAKAYGTHITSPMLKTGIKYFGTMLGDGGEEALQKLIETANKRSTYNPNARVSGKELAYEGILGGLVAGFFNAPDVPVNYRAYKSDFDTVNGLSKAAAAVTSFDEARYVLLQCDILLDECNIALGDTSAPVNETDFDTRARYEYIRNGVQRIKDTLQTDSTAIIEGNTIFNDAVDSAIGIDFGATADMNVDKDEAYEEEEDYEEDEEAEAEEEEAEPEKTLTKKEQREIAKRQKRIQKLQEQLDRITRRSPNSPVTPGDLAIYDEIRTLRAEIDTILGEQMTPETVADVVEAATENAEPGTDAVRATIDRVNDAIVDINETAEAVREMNDEEFRDWMRANRMSGPFSGIVDAVVNRQTNLLPGPSGRSTDLSVETAMNTDLAKNQILSDLELKKAGLQQIDSFLRNHKAEVTEALGVQEQHPDQQNILPSAGESDIIGSEPAENATEQRAPKYTVTRQSYTHTKTHDKFELLQTPEGLSAEDRSEFKKAVKDNGGYWSGFAKGWLVPVGKWDGVRNALDRLNIGISEKATETAPSTESSTPSTESSTETTAPSTANERGGPAQGRAPEFVVGGPSESAGAETITAERPDIPEFEVAGNTDMVPQSGTTEVQNGSETAVDEAGTRSDTGRGTNETADNGTVSTATAPEVDGLNAPETTTGKTNVNADSGKEPEEFEKAQEKWTPESKDKLTDENFPYKVGDTFKRPNSGAECKIESFGGGMITLDFGNYIPLTMEYSSFASQLRNGQLIESKVSRGAEQQAETKFDTLYDAVEKSLATQDTVRQNGFEFRIENRPQSYVEYGGVIQRYTMSGDQPVRQGKQLYNSATQHGWSRDRSEVAKDLANFARENKLLDPPQEDKTEEESPKRTTPAKTPKEGYMKFDSQAAYEEWTEQFADAYLYDHVPVLIDDGFKVSADMFVDCKRWKTAFDRFKKAFGNVEAFDGWFDQIEESAENGYFSGDWYKGGYPSGATKEEIADYAKGGTYSWGLEAVNDDEYYVYLNVSGIHAGRERQSQNAQENTSAKESETKPKDREPVAPTPKTKDTVTEAESDTRKNTTAEESEKKPEATAEPTEDTKPYTKIADWVADRIGRELSIDKNDLTVVANDAYGGTMGQGAYSVKDMTDALELGVNKHIIDDVSEYRDEYVGNARTAIGALRDINEFILNRIPTQTNRTEEQIAMQQFSTPPNIAYVANWVANIDGNDTMLEPSAGIGGLASFAKGMGAKTIVNELSERRLSLLKTLPFDGFYHENAEQIDNILPDSVKPTVVVMNPPFSANGRTKNKTANAIPHIEQALERLEPGGRLVAILGGGRDEGGGMSDSAPSFKAWWNKLRNDYSIRANIGIDGSNYKKYGTSFNVRLVVIDKTGAQEEPTLTGEYKDLVEAIKDLEEIRNDRVHAKPETDSGSERNGTVKGGKRPAESGTTKGGKRTDSGKRPSDGGGQNQPDENPAGEDVRSESSNGSGGELDVGDTVQPEGTVSSPDGERGTGRGGKRGAVTESDGNSEQGEGGTGRMGSADTGAGTSGESGELVRPDAGVSGTAGEVTEQADAEEYAVGDVLEADGKRYIVTSIENGEPQLALHPYQLGYVVEVNGKNYKIVDFDENGEPIAEEYTAPRKKKSNVSYSVKAPERITLPTKNLVDALKNNQIRILSTSKSGQSSALVKPQTGTISLNDLKKKLGANTTVKKVSNVSSSEGGVKIRTPEKPTTIDEVSVAVPTDTNAPGAAGTLETDERKMPKKAQKPQKQKAAENDDGIYAEYRPSELTVKGAKKHPAVLVESSAMSAVPAPPLTYVPKLDQKLIEAGVWSDAQLETISYAGQAHQDHLPDGRRKGYFIGDGTGVGKGRQIAGIIADSFAHGHKKAVWISEKAPLIEDARRDWADAGGDPNDVWDFSKENTKRKQNAKKGKKYAFPDRGILFVPYSTLRAAEKSGKTNVEVIEEWLGLKTSDCIIFDEAHNMANLEASSSGFGKTEGSHMARAGNKLQDDLPDASVTYLSATGATKVENLAYASRLGLWGEKTAFKDARDFAAKIGSAGLSAMELVARDMKAMGVYLARSISYDGVVYDNISHNLDDMQTAMYDRMSDAWQVVLQNFDKAIELTGSEKAQVVKRKRSQAYSVMQTFYNQVLTSMSMPTVIANIEKELAEGRSCVIQLVNTQEAALKSALSKSKERASETGEEEDFDDLDLTPRDALISYVMNAFPVQQYEDILDENGNTISVPVFDSTGEPVLNKQAVRMRDALIEDLNNISVPEGPLDMLILHFGADAVAEITGRKNRVVNQVDDHGNIKKVHERRDSKKANVAEGQAFQDGKKRILVFSSAGATGRSFHADKRAKNQQQRVHYVLQPGWRADQAVQGFGRTHRSNQVSAPIFRLVSTNVRGHKRFVTSIARRLDQLGALTKGQRETGSGVFGEKDNLESPLSSEALRLFYKTLAKGGYRKQFGLDGEDIFKKLGLYDKFFDEWGNYNPDMEIAGKITTFLNRILALHVDEQNNVFGAFEQERDRMYNAAIENGTLDRGLENVKADKIDIEDEEVVYTDPATGAETKYVRAKLYDKPEVVTTVSEAESKYPGFTGIYRMPDGSVKAAYRRRDGTDAHTGEVYRQYMLIGPNQGKVSNYRESTLKDTCTEIPKKEWQSAWDEDLKNVPAYNESEVHMITGALLPIWNMLPENGSIKARRITASTGEQFLGRIIAPDLIAETLRMLDVDVKEVQHSGAELRDAIMKQGKTVTFKGGLMGGVITVSRRRVNNENRMEVVANNMYGLARTYPDIFSEYIQYRTRYFIPDNRQGEAILQKLSDQNGVRSIAEAENSGQQYSAGASHGRWGKGKRDKNAEIRSVNDLVDEAQRIFGMPINTGKMNAPRNVQGVFKDFPETIRTRQYGDLPTIFHEVGHWFDKKYDLRTSPYVSTLINEYETDLRNRGYGDEEITGESVAEYFREYLSNREETEDKFPKFTQWMYKQLNTRDNKGLLEYSGMTNAYFSADLERRADAQVHYRTDEDTILGNAQVVAEYLKEDPHGYLGGKGRDFMRAWFDDIHDLRGIARAYDLAFLARRANGIAAARLKYHMTNLNGDIVGPSLATILSAGQITDKATRKEFDKYLIARRALDHFMANTLGENLPTLVYADEELNNPDVLMDRIRRYDDMYPSFREASERLYALQNQMLDLAIESGIMPTRGDMTMEDMKQRLNELYPHYVPLYRKMDDPQTKAVAGSKYGSNNSPIAHFKGSGRDIYSPIENIMINMAKYTSLSLVAQVKRNIYDFVTQNEGMGMIAEEVPASKILDRVSTDEIKKKLDALGKDVEALSYLSEDAKKDVLDTITEVIGDTTGQWKIKTKQGTNIMPVMVDGKVHYLEIHDEGLMKTLENLEPKQFNLLTRFMGSFTRFKKLFATGINAKFAATNVARDLNTGFVSSSTTNNPIKYGADFIKEFISTLMEDERFQYFQLQGGGYMGAYTHDYDLLRKLNEEVMNNAPNIKKVFRAITGIMMKLIESGENASRQAEFYRAVNKGFDNLDAFRMSQEVTVNFDRGGSYVKGINQYVPYRQAAFNAFYHTADLFASGGRGGRGGNGGGNNTNDSVSRNRRNAITKWIMLGVASALLAALLSYLIGNKLKGESKEKILEEREKLSKYRKTNYWNIYIGDGKFLELRKETMLNAPLNTIERLVDYYVLDQGDALDGLAGDLVDAILPVDVLHPINDIVGGTSGLGTIYNLARNKDFKDTPIEPEWMERQNIPLAQRYSDTTSEVWKKLGEILNQSPIKMQYAIEDNFAFWGQTFDRATSKSGDVWAGFNNSFIADNVYSTDIINTFYNQKEKYDSPKKGEDELETDYGSWKYQQIAGMYSDLNRFYKNENDSDYARMMRSTTNNLILQVNRAGMTDLDKAVIETIRGNTTEIKDVCPYITPPDHYTEQKVQFDMGYEDKVTYYLQEQEMFKEGYAQILQSGYDNDTTSAMLVAYHKEVKKQLDAYWKQLLIDRAVNGQ